MKIELEPCYGCKQTPKAEQLDQKYWQVVCHCPSGEHCSGSTEYEASQEWNDKMTECIADKSRERGEELSK